jgi:hypothetical protein
VGNSCLQSLLGQSPSYYKIGKSTFVSKGLSAATENAETIGSVTARRRHEQTLRFEPRPRLCKRQFHFLRTLLRIGWKAIVSRSGKGLRLDCRKVRKPTLFPVYSDLEHRQQFCRKFFGSEREQNLRVRNNSGEVVHQSVQFMQGLLNIGHFLELVAALDDFDFTCRIVTARIPERL